MIDEHAEVIVQIGSGLPQLKASKIQSVMELWDRGMLGNPQDPENQRKALSALDLGELEGMQETSRRDEDLVEDVGLVGRNDRNPGRGACDPAKLLFDGDAEPAGGFEPAVFPGGPPARSCVCGDLPNSE